MCIIMFKCKGSSFPSQQTISNCMDRNPDGFAMAWNEPDGSLRNFQTMDRGEALKRYIRLVKTHDPEKTALIFHARIATHGSKKRENCHCWLADTKIGDVAFAHNGILSNVPNRDDMTDSETFFRDYFLPTLEGAGLETAGKVAKAIAGNSKFAFLFEGGHISCVGAFEKHADKGAKGVCYYSNSSYVGIGASLFPGYRSGSSPRYNSMYSIHFDRNSDRRAVRKENNGSLTVTRGEPR